MTLRLKGISTAAKEGSCVACGAPGSDGTRMRDPNMQVIILQIGSMCPQLCRSCVRKLKELADNALDVAGIR